MAKVPQDGGPGTEAPRPRCGIVRREIAGETILVPVLGNAADMQRIYSLNPTAAFVWGLLDGARSTDEILEEVVAAFAVEREEARADLQRLLAVAREERLIDVPE